MTTPMSEAEERIAWLESQNEKLRVMNLAWDREVQRICRMVHHYLLATPEQKALLYQPLLDEVAGRYGPKPAAEEGAIRERKPCGS